MASMNVCTVYPLGLKLAIFKTRIKLNASNISHFRYQGVIPNNYTNVINFQNPSNAHRGSRVTKVVIYCKHSVLDEFSGTVYNISKWKDIKRA